MLHLKAKATWMLTLIVLACAGVDAFSLEPYKDWRSVVESSEEYKKWCADVQCHQFIMQHDMQFTIGELTKNVLNWKDCLSLRYTLEAMIINKARNDYAVVDAEEVMKESDFCKLPKRIESVPTATPSVHADLFTSTTERPSGSPTSAAPKKYQITGKDLQKSTTRGGGGGSRSYTLFWILPITAFALILLAVAGTFVYRRYLREKIHWPKQGPVTIDWNRLSHMTLNEVD